MTSGGLYVAVLVAASLSLIAAAATLLLFGTRHYRRPAPSSSPSRSSSPRSSRLLWIVMMLILSDGCVAVCALVWHFLQNEEDDVDTLRHKCRMFLPFPIFFFLAGYGWTIMVAWRFQQVSERVKLYEPPLAVVWLGAFLLVLPIIIQNSMWREDHDVANIITANYGSSSHKYCVFDSSSSRGRWTNNLCFQVPLLVTIACNIHAFIRGIQALRHSPHSVVAREMNRAGKYLMVLLLVWVPNFLANLVQEIDSAYSDDETDDGDDDNLDSNVSYLVDIMILLSSLQGLLNVAVYALGHRTFKQYLKEALPGGRKNQFNVASPLLRNDHSRPSWMPPSTNGDTTPPPVNEAQTPSTQDSAVAKSNFGINRKSSMSDNTQDENSVSSKFSRLDGPEKSVRFASTT